jgi:hypothetical protein
MQYVVKRITLSIWILLSLLLVACQKDEYIPSEPTEPSKETENVIVSEIKYTKDEKAYVSYLGQPYVIIGGQIRLDGLLNRGTGQNEPPQGAPLSLSYEAIERYFLEAKNFGLNTVQVPIEWGRLEIAEGVYDFSYLDEILKMVNKYDLKMEILWFSTNMVGDSHSFHLPDYIWQDETRFPRMKAKIDDSFIDSYYSWMYGHVGHLVLDTPLLMEKEQTMIEHMMSYIDRWNQENDLKYPVLSIQVHNESDGLLRWRVDQKNLHLNGVKVTKERIWEMILNALDNAGKAFKSADYKVFTRTNMTVSLGVSNFPQAPFASPLDVLALEGIDIVGDDPYVEDPSIIKDMILSYSVPGNYPHVAENMGNYPSTPSMMLQAYQAGGSYAIYDFVTPKFFTWMNTYYNSSYQMDQGVLQDNFEDKPHSELTRRIISGINKGAYLFATLPIDHIHAFNVTTKLPLETHSETITINDISLTIRTKNQALGYVMIDDEDNLYVYGTDILEINVSGKTVSPFANIGYFNDLGEYISTDKMYPSGEYLAIEEGMLYQFRLS